MKEQETQIDLSKRLISLVHSKAQGTQGLDPLIEGCIKEIMDRNGVFPETQQKFVPKQSGGE